MNLYLDTSMILPVLLHRHENHIICRKLLQGRLNNESVLSTASHTYGELYRHITRNVAPFELAPSLAERTLSALSAIIRFEDATAAIYRLAIERCCKLDLRGAIIYDALHLETAIKVEAKILYTDNTKDFNRLMTTEDSIVIKGIH